MLFYYNFSDLKKESYFLNKKRNIPSSKVKLLIFLNIRKH